MFVDQAKLEVFAGKGGDGIVAYRRELKVERGGPFGGNGGKGGSVIFVADEGLSTLLDFRYNKKIKADEGEKGRNKGCYGANAKDTIVRVPVGTTIFDDGSTGNTGSLSYTRRLKTSTKFDVNAKVDAFICQISTNDAKSEFQTRRGEISDSLTEFDLTTTLGGVEFIINYVKETWDCPVYFYSGSYISVSGVRLLRACRYYLSYRQR